MRQSFWLRKRGELLLYGTAALLLVAFSWYSGLINSEDRWAEAAHEMLLSGDWLHPALNGQIYFDKPPLSYWLVAISSWCFGGVSEFSLRLPSIIAALIGLWATVWLARQMFNSTIGLTAGWVLTGCYGFLYLGRSGEADIQSMAAIILAVAWLYHCREKGNFQSYLLFYLICFAGALTKGLPSVIVPAVAGFILLLPGRLWLKHLKFSNFCAFGIGLCLYLLPFYLAGEIAPPAYYTWPELKLSGLELVWRENIVRALDPYDHKGEWYLYFYELPRILIPWVPVFAAALVAFGRDYRKQTPAAHALCGAIVAIFILFSLSGSRRWYYILPALPFCAILTAEFLGAERRGKWENWLIVTLRYLIIVTASLMVVAVLVFPFLEAWLEIALPPLLYIGTPVTGLLALGIMFLEESAAGRQRLAAWFRLPPPVTGLLVGTAILSGGFFSCLLPSFDAFRTTEPFVIETLRPVIDPLPGDNVIVLTPMLRGPLLFYMKRSSPVVTIDLDADDMELGWRRLGAILDAKRQETVVLISTTRDLRKLTDALGALPTFDRFDWATPDLVEPNFKLAKDNKRKVVAWVLPPLTAPEVKDVATP